MNVDPEKIVRASMEIDRGCPVKDFLSDQEVEEVVHAFADVLVLMGVRVTGDDDE